MDFFEIKKEPVEHITNFPEVKKELVQESHHNLLVDFDCIKYEQFEVKPEKIDVEFDNVENKVYITNKVDTDGSKLQHNRIEQPSIGEKPWDNQQCDNSNSENAKKHFKCEKCDYNSFQRGRFNRHVISSHLEHKSFTCDKCEYKCSRRYTLLQHLLTHSRAREKPFNLKPCNEPCNDKKISSFKCDKCNYKTNKETLFTSHIGIHSGATLPSEDKLFKCEKCEYRSCRRTHLMQHSLVHSKDKMFKCDTCGYKTFQKDYLVKHILIHSGEKPFACDKCEYKSTRKGNLRQHLLQHSDEKPFNCNQCDYKCISKKSFVRHEQIHVK